jgi:hypothetical protein
VKTVARTCPVALLFCLAWLAMAGPSLASARTVAGVTLPERVQVPGDKDELQLNGAGIRSKYMFDVYVAALYLPRPARDAEAVLTMPGAKRIAMHFLFDISREKLLEGWREGFTFNLDPQQIEALRPRIERSYRFFRSVRQGDTVFIDYLPDQGTCLRINGERKGCIPGADFYRAVLQVWLGKHPIQYPLKRQMLGLLD